MLGGVFGLLRVLFVGRSFSGVVVVRVGLLVVLLFVRVGRGVSFYGRRGNYCIGFGERR